MPPQRRAGQGDGHARPLLVLGLLVLWVAALFWSGAARAQQDGVATLVADRLFIDGGTRLVAEGNVEALFGEARLQASRVSYDRATGQIRVDGPLVLDEGREVLILADQAELSDDLERALILSARLVFDEQLQMAAGSAERLSPRFTELSNVVASSCEICARRRTPLWELRSSRVVHDEEEQQIYFEGAQFRLFGLPVAYIPRLRVPDPRLERATGFLAPRLSASTGHGVGLRAPYFIVLGADRDVTLTPFLANRGTRALEVRYRQAFASGRLELGGLVARDSIRPGGLRGFGLARGEFALGRGYALRFNLIQPSDSTVLEDYDRPQSRPTSDITVERIRRDERIRLQLLQFRSLRRADVNATLPNRVGQAVIERREDVPGLGGVASLRLEAHAHRRAMPLPTGLPEPVPGFGAGPRPRHLGRVSLDLGWRRDAVLPGGVLAAAEAHLGLDHFRLGDTGGSFPTSQSRVTPTLTAELRWPLVRAGGAGASHVVEPVAQFVWSRDQVSALPYEGNRLPELDEGNLFARDRFAARDSREVGMRANLGLSWTRHDPQGWSSTLTLGRIWRPTDLGQFSSASPLAGARSAWLLAGSLDATDGLTLSNRSLFDTDLRLQRTALELDWSTETYSLSTSYMRILADPFEDRAAMASEWSLEGARQIDEMWEARISWRYDIAQSRAARAMVGLNYENECLRMEMGLERQFASASAAAGRTSFGLNINLLGIGGNPGRARRACNEM